MTPRLRDYYFNGIFFWRGKQYDALIRTTSKKRAAEVLHTTTYSLQHGSGYVFKPEYKDLLDQHPPHTLLVRDASHSRRGDWLRLDAI